MVIYMPAPKDGMRRLRRMVAIVVWGPLVRLLVLLWDLADGLTGCKAAEGFGVVTVLQSCPLSMSLMSLDETPALLKGPTAWCKGDRPSAAPVVLILRGCCSLVPRSGLWGACVSSPVF